MTTSFLLSREELLLLLKLLNADYILGLTPDPLGELSAKQQAFAFIYAERALRARQLATVDEQGVLKVQRELLDIIGICVYPERSVVAHHILPNKQASLFTGHCREAQYAIHLIPEAALHHITLHPTSATFFNELIAFCRCQKLPEALTEGMFIDGETYKRLCESVSSGNELASLNLLLEQGVTHDSAQSFVTTLLAPHTISVVQFLNPLSTNSLAKREMTILQSESQAWLVVQSNRIDSDELVSIQPLTTQMLTRVLLETWHEDVSQANGEQYEIAPIK